MGRKEERSGEGDRSGECGKVGEDEWGGGEEKLGSGRARDGGGVFWKGKEERMTE